MEINAQLDVDIVAVETEDEVRVMLELNAPAAKQDKPRTPASVQVVLDRSGSMHGGRLEAAKQALIQLVDRLDPADSFGLVAFDHEVTVTVPAHALADKAPVRRAIASLEPGGMTNLSAGLLRGYQEAHRAATDTGATVVLLSDGHANDGEVDPVRLAGIATKARADLITTSTVGIGLGYDELILAELAKGGQGNHVFAEQADGAAQAVAGEVTGLLSKTVQAASLRIRPRNSVGEIKIWNDLPSYWVDSEVVVELGDLWSAEQRRLLLGFTVPAMDELGLAQVADLELRYVLVPDLVEQTVKLPVAVNVVPGDQAKGRIPNPEVISELVFQQAQDAKRKAAEQVRNGDVAQARDTYREAMRTASARCSEAPSKELAEEVEILRALDQRLAKGDAAWSARTSRAEQALKSRMRGR